MAKKKTPPPAAKKPAPAKEAPKAAPKAHERKAKPSEEDRIEKGKSLAAAYLTRRDGMDGDTARAIVDSMDPADIAALNTEAATAVIEKTKALTEAESKKAPASSVIPEEDTSAYAPFTDYTALATDEDFPPLVLEVAELAREKNAAEAEYKAKKKILIAKLNAAGAEKAECLGIKLAVYEGHNKMLNEQLLLEKGVSPDVILKCWKDTPYDDVRIMSPKPPKEG